MLAVSGVPQFSFLWFLILHLPPDTRGGFLTSGILKAMFQEGKGGNRKLSGALDFIDMSFLPYSISQTSYKVRPGSKYGKLIPFLD